MASKFQETQREKQIEFISTSDLFQNTEGGGVFFGKKRDFVLKNSDFNLYGRLSESVKKYFEDNDIVWWGGKNIPSGHTLSSQIACLNHLFPIRNDRDAVLKLNHSTD